MGLKGRQGELKINTMNSSALMDSQVVSFSIKPQNPSHGSYMHINGAYALNVKSFQCTTQTCSPSWDHCKDLDMPSEIKPDQVKLLIGLDNPEAHVQLEVRRGEPEDPLVVRTNLGWSLMGGDCNRESEFEPVSVNLIGVDQPARKDLNLEEFWTTEAFGVASKCTKPSSMEDLKAQKFLEDTTTFQDGHNVVGMLWRDLDSKLPNNITAARRRFDHLMKRFNQDPEYAKLYQETMNGYISQGYARLMTAKEAAVSTPRTWYLLHHGVTNPNKPGKVRVVYDAASSFQGHSLNSALMSGPDLLNSLFGVLQRFRLKPVGLVTDIRAMYHQVRVPENEADSLRFLFKEDVETPGPPQTYQMVSHVFGATDSPAYALYALRRTATDNAKEFSQEAVDMILRDSYMDDIAGAIGEVPSAAQEVDLLLIKGGFGTHQWLSNSRDVMEALHSLDLLTQEVRFDHDDHYIQRTLGVRWDIQDDVFTFVSQVKENPMTKRGLVSTMSSIFDPCGFRTPFTLRAKLLAQDLWKLGIGWDEDLPPETLGKWQDWRVE
ncbi:uncharacterized protein LOC135494046 [Lineus longissimus]|uniref:uncharacterized protein LOC135494046 n=1 Tax=Lineus longissimus TaxID=88925 RepID=UPI00315CB7DF